MCKADNMQEGDAASSGKRGRRRATPHPQYHSPCEGALLPVLHSAIVRFVYRESQYTNQQPPSTAQPGVVQLTQERARIAYGTLKHFPYHHAACRCDGTFRVSCVLGFAPAELTAAVSVGQDRIPLLHVFKYHACANGLASLGSPRLQKETKKA